MEVVEVVEVTESMGRDTIIRVRRMEGSFPNDNI